MQSQSLVLPEPGLFLGQPLLSATKFKINLNRNYLAKGLLLASQVSILVGPPNTGKSSVVACLAASISMGRAVGETRVKRAAVLYVAAEDPNGIAERAYGFFQTEPTDLAHFYIHGFPVNLADEAEMKAFCAEAKRLRREVEAARLLIVFDTRARAWRASSVIRSDSGVCAEVVADGDSYTRRGADSALCAKISLIFSVLVVVIGCPFSVWTSDVAAGFRKEMTCQEDF